MAPPSNDRTLDRTETESNGGAVRDALVSHPHLFLVIEGARPEAGGARHVLSGVDEVLVGRGKQRSARRAFEDGKRRLILEVPDARMSSAHAVLSRDRAGWTCTDAGSRNGTRVNGAEVKSARLDDGDAIELGRTTFRFRRALPSPPAAPADLDFEALASLPPSFATLVPEHAHRAEALVRVAGESTAPVLVLGETGTGKELVARAVHECSRRRGRLVAVNCAAIPGTLAESQLFGHVKGAFSGALADEPGFIRASSGGTLFLDEIGELALPLQAVLLRTLQEREVTPVGTTEPLKVDLRLVAATNASLPSAVEAGTFRSDLYARLAGYTFHLVPLRERIEDLGVLIARIAARHGLRVTLSSDAVRALLSNDWPRNVRELEQALTVGAVLAAGKEIERRHLPAELQASPPAPRKAPAKLDDDALRAELIAQLAKHGGNVSKVADAMGKARMQIHRWMKRFGIDSEQYKPPL